VGGESWKKITPAEAGVRKYCANTREIVNLHIISV
jgi:hypothetical protein